MAIFKQAWIAFNFHYICHMTETFTQLGLRLRDFPDQKEIIDAACRANGWFMPQDITYAVEALRTRMLDGKLLTEYLKGYSTEAGLTPDSASVPLPVAKQKNVGVVMAGNIPLVGFHDMLCVLFSGHACYIKPSSKDRILMDYIAGLLKEIDPGIPLHWLNNQALDGVIATGSSNTARYFRSRYRDIPSIVRGSRSSLAVLRGDETSKQLEALAGDIFRYSGLGCRNVSRLLIAEDYNIGKLCEVLQDYSGPVNPRYRNNYLQAKAVRTIEGDAFHDGGFFILSEADGFSTYISEITYTRFTDFAHLGWLIEREAQQLQCIVADNLPHPLCIPFGQSQLPGPGDYADGIDTMDFLLNL